MAASTQNEFHQLEAGLRTAIHDYEVKTGEGVEFARTSLWQRAIEFTKRYPLQVAVTCVGLGLLAAKLIRRR